MAESERTSSSTAAILTQPVQPSASTASTHTPHGFTQTTSDTTAELTGADIGAVLASAATSERSILDTSTIAPTTERDAAAAIVSPPAESQTVIHDRTDDALSPMLVEKERSSTIDEAVAKFHEAVGSAPKVSKDALVSEDLPTVEEESMAEKTVGRSLGEAGIGSGDMREGVDTPSRRYTPTYSRIRGELPNEGSATREVEVEGTTMDEVDLD